VDYHDYDDDRERDDAEADRGDEDYHDLASMDRRELRAVVRSGGRRAETAAHMLRRWFEKKRTDHAPPQRHDERL
jgi:hypothetical protein